MIIHSPLPRQYRGYSICPRWVEGRWVYRISHTASGEGLNTVDSPTDAEKTIDEWMIAP